MFASCRHYTLILLYFNLFRKAGAADFSGASQRDACLPVGRARSRGNFHQKIPDPEKSAAPAFHFSYPHLIHTLCTYRI